MIIHAGLQPNRIANGSLCELGTIGSTYGHKQPAHPVVGAVPKIVGLGFVNRKTIIGKAIVISQTVECIFLIGFDPAGWMVQRHVYVLLVRAYTRIPPGASLLIQKIGCVCALQWTGRLYVFR